MEIKDAVAALSALSQPTRLAAFRLLVRAGPDGLAAGSVARALKTPAATMSFHLARLAGAGLVTTHRDSRSVIYAARFDRMRTLLEYLTEDCCQGHPEICLPGMFGPARERAGGPAEPPAETITRAPERT